MASETIYSFSAKDIKGQEVSMDDYRGKVLLIVNTASKCGFTPQFEGLQSLHDELGNAGLRCWASPVISS
jgi:glutathione peroxidase